ncbi:MAG: GldG family protein [bacterium]|nr:GldG family protein [bacterium]
MIDKIKQYIGYAGLLLLIMGSLNYITGGILTTATKFLLLTGLVIIAAWCFFNIEMIKASLKARFAQHLSNAIIASLLVLAILTMVNFVGSKRNYRHDFTEAKINTISPQTTRILENLEEEVAITSFFKSANATIIESLIDEYEYFSDKIIFQNVDPDKKPGIAKNYGVTKYETIVLESRGKTEKIEAFDYQNAEQIMTNALIKVSREGKKVIYYLSGHGEHGFDDQDRLGFAKIKGMIIEQNYDLMELNLARAKSIPDDCSLIIVNGPKTELFPVEVENINTYINGGGKVFFLVDPSPSPGLEDFFDEWGVTIGNDLVIDASGVGQLFGMGPSIPLATDYGIHPITQGFNQNTFYPGARSVTPKEQLPEGISIQYLVRTTQNSWGEVDYQQAAATEGSAEGIQVEFNDGRDLKGPVNIAVVITKEPDAAAGADPDAQGAIVVFGDSEFSSNAYADPRNSALFMNVLNWLAEEEDLVAIPPKSPTDRRVEMTAGQAKQIMYLTVFIIPAFFVVSGVMVFIRRRKL